MVIYVMQIRVDSEMQPEFLQAYHSVLTMIRNGRGCIACRLTRDTEDPRLFCLQGEWNSREDLDRHLRTDLFRVLVGAARTLGGEAETRTMIVPDGGEPAPSPHGPRRKRRPAR